MHAWAEVGGSEKGGADGAWVEVGGSSRTIWAGIMCDSVFWGRRTILRQWVLARCLLPGDRAQEGCGVPGNLKNLRGTQLEGQVPSPCPSLFSGPAHTAGLPWSLGV